MPHTPDSSISKPIQSAILKEVARQGLPFLLLCGGIYFLYTEVKNIQLEVKECNNSIMEYYQNDHKEALKVLKEIKQFTDRIMIIILRMIKSRNKKRGTISYSSF